MSNEPIPPWQQIADHSRDHARRCWAVSHWLTSTAAAELPDAEALIAELDEHWDAIERLHDRIRHQARRLEQKQRTAGRPLSTDDRATLFPEEPKR